MFSLKFLLAYGMVLVIMFAYAIVWQQILKKFDLTIAYANKAAVILFGIVWGAIIFREKISWNMIVGSVIIIIGIWMVAKDHEG
ncbi:MAG: EamA family transporter [Clostridium sp.]|nr:EamA family transporter [Clostridium sp.]